MYLVGEGHEHMGPGTSMVQRINWTRPQEMRLMNASQGRGMGTVGMVPEFFSDCRTMGKRGLGCGCTTPCANCGLGLFDSMDFTTWGWPEYVIIGIAGYMFVSTIFTTKRAVGRVRALPGERRKRKAASLRKQADELTRKGGGSRGKRKAAFEF